MGPEAVQALDSIMPGRVRRDQPLAGLTTFRLGGPAAAFVEPENRDELAAVLRLARELALPLFILGGGSNVLFRDGGFPGVVIRLGRGLAGVEAVPDLDRPGARVTVGAAERNARLVRYCLEKGLSGLEFLAGIPGRVGGALAMNAGAHGGEIANALAELEIMTPDGQIAALARSEIKARYRGLELPAGAVILSGTFHLAPADPREVKSAVAGLLARRLAGQPRGVHSAGCVFRNPAGQSAGRLIDQAGLKGLMVGRAFVAPEHANFIVHRGGAAAWQVLALMEAVKSAVKARFGLDLEPEIKIVGVNGQ
ncbi:MAG: UDP-N-acetylmuramate dehydrogenase [Pseudomonadota bacterium]